MEGIPLTMTAGAQPPVTGPDVTLSGTAGATTATETGSGRTYNVAVSGMTRHGTVISSVPAGIAHNSLNYPNLTSTSTDNKVLFSILPSPDSLTPSTGKLPLANRVTPGSMLKAWMCVTDKKGVGSAWVPEGEYTF